MADDFPCEMKSDNPEIQAELDRIAKDPRFLEHVKHGLSDSIVNSMMVGRFVPPKPDYENCEWCRHIRDKMNEVITNAGTDNSDVQLGTLDTIALRDTPETSGD